MRFLKQNSSKLNINVNHIKSSGGGCTDNSTSHDNVNIKNSFMF